MPTAKVLLLSLYYPPDLSAGSFRAQALVNELAAQSDGYTLDVITGEPSRYGSWRPDDDQSVLPAGVRLRRVSLPQIRAGLLGQALMMLVFMFKACRLARGQDYQLVVATSSRLMTAVLGAWIAKRQQAALYLDIRDIFVETLSHLYPGKLWRPVLAVLDRLERWAIGRADKVNLVSRGFASYFEARYPGCSFSFFPNGVDALFEDAVNEQGCSQKSLASAEGRLNILYAGNVGDGQGLHLILPELARQLGSRVTFRVIGDGGRLEALRRALQECQVDSVILLPPLTRASLKQCYQDADVLFLHLNDIPAFRRVLPSKVFEYAATGKPILAGVSGYAAEFIQQELSNVAVFPPLDVGGAVRGLEQLKLEQCDRGGFVARFSRELIMRDMVADIRSLFAGQSHR